MPPDRPGKPRDALGLLQSEVQTLDSKLNLLTQQVKTMEKNQDIVGRTMIALNEKIEKSAREASSGGAGGAGGSMDESKFATKQELRELKALLDSINPLEYATIDQVKELLEETAKKSERKRF